MKLELVKMPCGCVCLSTPDRESNYLISDCDTGHMCSRKLPKSHFSSLTNEAQPTPLSKADWEYWWEMFCKNNLSFEKLKAIHWALDKAQGE